MCQDPLIFITHKGKVGLTPKGSSTYEQCLKDLELKRTMKSVQKNKFSFGDIVKTPTLTDVYMGTITQYYIFSIGANARRYSTHIDYRDCVLTKLAKPVTYHIFDSKFKETRLTDFLNYYDESFYAYPSFKKSCPKRVIDGKIELDCTEEEFKKRLVSKIYDFDACIERFKKSSVYEPIYYFLSKTTFGFNFEPFELDANLLKQVKKAGIKYIEEESFIKPIEICLQK
jgi:hypothetical protein